MKAGIYTILAIITLSVFDVVVAVISKQIFCFQFSVLGGVCGLLLYDKFKKREAEKLNEVKNG